MQKYCFQTHKHGRDHCRWLRVLYFFLLLLKTWPSGECRFWKCAIYSIRIFHIFKVVVCNRMNWMYAKKYSYLTHIEMATEEMRMANMLLYFIYRKPFFFSSTLYTKRDFSVIGIRTSDKAYTLHCCLNS